MAAAPTTDELRACGSKLTPEQATALTADLNKAANPTAAASTATASTAGSAAASTAATCTQTADYANSLVRPFLPPGSTDDDAEVTAFRGMVVRSIVLARCVADHWSDIARACMTAAPTINELKACGSKLAPEQATALAADFDKADDAMTVEVSKVKGATTPAMQRHPSLVLNIAADGAVTAASIAFDDAKIDKLFHAAFLHDPMTEVVLRANRGTSHSRVVALMELAKAAGLTHLAIGTAP